MADDYAYSNVDDDSTGIIVAKYFMHGAAFIYLMVVLLVAWIFVTLMIAFMIVPGVSLGVLNILGVVIASFAILFMVIGWLNAQVSQHIWKIQVKRNLFSLLKHGVLLVIVIAIAGIPFMIINAMMLYADLFTYVKFIIVSFLIYSLVDGYICKRVADVFTDDELTTRTTSVSVLDRTAFRGQCSHCGAVYIYKHSVIGPSGTVKCFNCGQLFAPKIPAQPPRRKPSSLRTVKHTIIESTKLQLVCPSCSQKGNYSDEDAFAGSIRCHNCGATFSPSSEGD